MPTDPAVKEMENLIHEEVRALGFTKKGKKWTRVSAETITRLTLRKDLWRRDQSYLKIDTSVRELNPAESAEEINWHIFGSMFSPDVAEIVEWEKCLNTRYSEVSGKIRQVRFKEILQTKIIPLLHALETLEGIKQVLFSNQLRGMAVHTKLQNLTGYRA